jgi:hypothetical protein
MPRLSLWRQNKTNDYKYLDNIVREQYTVGGLDIYIHKYLGPKVKPDDGSEGDATQPVYDESNPLFIEDLLFLENRDREYDDDVYQLRGVYNVSDIDFNLSQFGLFIQNDTLYISFHYNDMIDHIGRKLMNGDVLEVPNLKDYHPLDETIPKALPKLYVIQDANFASEGFSQTWLPHIWRVKATPLVGSQEYKDVLDNYIDEDEPADGTLADYLCTYNKNLDINEKIIEQANNEVPLSGYDVSKFYIAPYGKDGEPEDGTSVTGDDTTIFADTDLETADTSLISPVSDGYALGYLTGDSIPPNGIAVTPGMSFPLEPLEGDYSLRLDYMPNRLFRFDGIKWVKQEDAVRTALAYLNSEAETQRSGFFNNTATIETSDRGTIPSRQSLSDILKPSADN